MKKLLLIALTLCTLNGMAQDVDLVLFFEGAKCGLKDKTGKVVVPAAYEAVHAVFSEGLTIAMLNQKWGFIDQTGKEVIPFIYDDAGNFSDGLAFAQLNGKWGGIDKTGKEIIPFIYDNVATFGKDLAKAKQGKQTKLINTTTGEVVGSLRIDYENVGEFIDGTAIVSFMRLAGEDLLGRRGITTLHMALWQGVIDQTGKEIIFPRPNRLIKRHTDGTFEVFVKKGGAKKVKIVSTTLFYDKTGKRVKGKKKTSFED